MAAHRLGVVDAELGGYIDVSYPFVYPGWVTQDTNGGSNAAVDLVWPLLAAGTVHRDETNAYWDYREDGLAFCTYYHRTDHVPPQCHCCPDCCGYY